ncbi:MAG: hypothetical protein WCT01_02390 [Candidatus Shapirobacteria bacterium]|jgi:hypothetical protein
MPRATDLDNIAPDDPITPPSEPPAQNLLSPPSPHHKKKKKNISSPANNIREEIDKILYGAKNSFGSFQIKPLNFVFSEQEKDEQIILVMRQHWFTNVRWILFTLLMVIAPLFLVYVPILSFFPPRYQMVSVLFWYIITFAFAFEQFLSWYFNLYIITDERVIDIDFVNLLNKRFSDAKISFIQDVTSQISGFSQTMFNYGNILIQTAAEQTQFIFEKVPNPDIVTKVLQQLRQEEEQEAIEGRLR